MSFVNCLKPLYKGTILGQRLGIFPKFSWWSPYIPVIHQTDLLLHIAVNIKWFSNWTLYYFNLIKPNLGKWKYSERYNCNSKLGNLNTAGNYQSPFVHAHLPPLCTWLVPREVQSGAVSVYGTLFSPLVYGAYGHKNWPYKAKNSKQSRFDEGRKRAAFYFSTDS